MIDPRLSIIKKRLENITRIVAVSGSKGGIGKSTVASALALALAEKGKRVGLLDLDLSGPSTHIILGVEGLFPEEDKGLIPPVVHGIKFMSIVYFIGNNPSPLRGNDISNIIIELLTITLWGSLDVLVLDMPPGISDSILDVIRFIGRMEFLVVTTQSKVAVEVTKKELKILRELNIPILGMIENMATREGSSLHKEVESLHIPILGSIKFDAELEDAIGDAQRLSRTGFMKSLVALLEKSTIFRPDTA
jgi:ATP-binding protein involved in chromosome partitioning